MEKLKLNLLENSQSFVVEALNKAVEAENNCDAWKFAIFNIVQSIELSLKEMLRIEHRVLIYKNVDKLTWTVNIEEALKRLDTILDFQLSSKEKDTLKFAQKIRDNIVHHEFEIHLSEIKLIFAKLFAFIVDFHEQHLNSHLKYKLPDELWRAGISIKDYAEELFARAVEKIKKEEPEDVLQCLICGYETFVVSEEYHLEATCYVCRHSDSICECPCGNFFSPELTDHESCDDKYCSLECLGYYTHDYWHERARGK